MWPMREGAGALALLPAFALLLAFLFAASPVLRSGLYCPLNLSGTGLKRSLVKLWPAAGANAHGASSSARIRPCQGLAQRRRRRCRGGSGTLVCPRPGRTDTNRLPHALTVASCVTESCDTSDA